MSQQFAAVATAQRQIPPAVQDSCTGGSLACPEVNSSARVEHKADDQRPWRKDPIEVHYRGQEFGLAPLVNKHLNSQIQGGIHYERA